jgi:hypothetical protein
VTNAVLRTGNGKTTDDSTAQSPTYGADTDESPMTNESTSNDSTT